ncbi:MAG: hypothetical protein NVS3B3_06860 [Aquirhabdus sp.]
MSTERDTQQGKRIALTLTAVLVLHGIVLFALMHSKVTVSQVPSVTTIAVRLISPTQDQAKPLPPKPIVKPKIVPDVKELPKPNPSPILMAPKAAVTPVVVPPPVAKPIEKPTPIAEPVAAPPPPRKADPTPPKVVQGVSYLVPPQVNYPEAALLSNVTGTTIVSTLINAYGLVDEVKIKQSSGSAILDKEALRAVKKARFEPRRENGVAIAVIAPVTINFTIEGDVNQY